MTKFLEQHSAWFGGMHAAELIALIPRGLRLHPESEDHLTCLYCWEHQRKWYRFGTNVGLQEHFQRRSWHGAAVVAVATLPAVEGAAHEPAVEGAAHEPTSSGGAAEQETVRAGEAMEDIADTANAAGGVGPADAPARPEEAWGQPGMPELSKRELFLAACGDPALQRWVDALLDCVAATQQESFPGTGLARLREQAGRLGEVPSLLAAAMPRVRTEHGAAWSNACASTFALQAGVLQVTLGGELRPLPRATQWAGVLHSLAQKALATGSADWEDAAEETMLRCVQICYNSAARQRDMPNRALLTRGGIKFEHHPGVASMKYTSARAMGYMSRQQWEDDTLWSRRARGEADLTDARSRSGRR